MTVWPGAVPGGPKQKTRQRGRAPTTWDYGGEKPVRLEDLARSVAPTAWRTVAWDDGSEKKTSRFYRQRVHPAPRDHFHGAWPEPEEWLLIEWPEGQDKPSHYWLSTLPEETSLEELVFAAKLRWRVELDYRQMKDELGLDHFEGRTWPGWNRHVTLVSTAYHFLVYQQLEGQKNG